MYFICFKQNYQNNLSLFAVTLHFSSFELSLMQLRISARFIQIATWYRL